MPEGQVNLSTQPRFYWAKLLLLALGIVAAYAGELQTERVFGPETPTGKYKHPACIETLRNGDLLLVYYGGAGEYATQTGVFGSRRRKGSTAWTAPRLLANDPFRSVGNAVLWQAPDEAIWLFYVVRWGKTWSTSRIQAKLSRDNGETWSDSFVVSEQPGLMVRNKPIVLQNGTYLLPAYHEAGDDTEFVAPDSTSRFLRFDAEAKAWNEVGRIRSAKGNLQPAVAEVSPNQLIAYCRRGGGYGPARDGYLVQASSRDGGTTWSEGQNSSLPNPNSAVEMLKLKSGALLLLYNDSMGERTPLTAALSLDGGATWPHRRNIGAQPKQSYAYPSASQGADGLIHLVYTSDNRTVVQHATFDEAWIKQQTTR